MFETRLSALEKQNRLLKVAVALLACAIGIVGLAGAQITPPSSGVIEGRSFRLLNDKGEQVAMLGCAQENNLSFLILGSKDGPRLTMTASTKEAGLWARAGDIETSMLASSIKDPGAIIRIFNGDKGMVASAGGDARIGFVDKDGVRGGVGIIQGKFGVTKD
jgi:hypothetical protein